MANSQSRIVNQRLYFCRLHLQWLDQQLQLQMLPKALLEQSLAESALFHLQMAYRAYLLEIAEAYNLKPDSIKSVEQLMACIGEQQLRSAEAYEIEQLAQQAESWLSSMLQVYAQLDEDSVSLPQQGYQQANMINISPVQAVGSCELSAELVHNCHQQLTALIENQRLRLQEW
ncbi:MAG: hypothetical protein ACJAYG_001920 [Oceanicoccus sp.]|jgi:hypothetical protein